jgi:SAM-dependent methyltransferase
MQARFGLSADSRVVEVAANDGYLLQYAQAAGIPCYGVEPTASTARAARAKGIDIVERFFGVALADELALAGRQADLMAANNVLAHVPDINDFVAGFARLLKPQGVATFEFPHLLRMVQGCQFDTAYHEHYSYLSLTAVQRIFAHNGLAVFDVQELPTHGGSLRVLAQRSDTGAHAVQAGVARVLADEQAAGISTPAFYASFQQQPLRIVRELLAFLVEQANRGGRVAAYGAAAKGNTFLNYCGTTCDDIVEAYDANPAKQDRYLPGSHIPVRAPDAVRASRPDYVLILPWNLKDEITRQLGFIADWGGRFVIASPETQVLD